MVVQKYVDDLTYSTVFVTLTEGRGTFVSNGTIKRIKFSESVLIDSGDLKFDRILLALAQHAR